MKTYNKPIELLIKTGGDVQTKSKAKTGFVARMKAAGVEFDLTEIDVAGSSTKKTKAAATTTLQAKSNVLDNEINPWDLAHITNKTIPDNSSFVEPDLLQEFVVEDKMKGSYKDMDESSLDPDDENFDPDWAPHQNNIWHLGEYFSQLKAAREQVAGNNFTVRIGHLDTGYTNHFAIPAAIRNNPLQRNFIEGENALSAEDMLVKKLGRMPGHGTGTLGILAGGKINIPISSGTFNDYLGGAYFADVVCCRISSSVILLKTSAFAQAIQYLVNLTHNGTPIHVVTMSMGGVPTQAWADAVNAAYEAGITMVTAAGNNYNSLPTRKLIYPARFGRVIGACGATYDNSPYYHDKLGEMQGCWGPKRYMDKAMAAYTPNMPWASYKTGKIKFSGAGTSSATPQIASAAAIYYKKYHAELEALKEPWMRVEAIRHALFSKANKTVTNAEESYKTYFGNGILRANDALSVPVLKNPKKTPVDDVPFLPLFSIIFKGKKPVNDKERQMFNIELAQLVQEHQTLQQLLHDDEKTFGELSIKDKKTFLDAVVEQRDASNSLKNFIRDNYTKLTSKTK